jgi:hypothetical protein
VTGGVGQVLGHGPSCGTVVRAEYRGTAVAVRVHSQPEPQGGSSKNWFRRHSSQHRASFFSPPDSPGAQAPFAEAVDSPLGAALVFRGAKGRISDNPGRLEGSYLGGTSSIVLDGDEPESPMEEPDAIGFNRKVIRGGREVEGGFAYNDCCGSLMHR